MATCRGCGAESNRTSSVFDEHMTFIKEVCKVCDPARFGEHHDPTDNRIYTGPAAKPQSYKNYKIDGEDVLFAKDELLQDTTDLWCNDVEDQAADKKRRLRRTEPMSPQEIKEAENWGRNTLRPELEKRRLNRQYAHVDN